MVLKKPYKILIKNFRFIHLILTILSIYLVIKTNNILSFFNEYATSSSLISTSNLTEQLFNPLLFIIPIFVIILIAMIIYLLKWKHKPIHFYIFNMVVYISIIGCYMYIYSICNILENGVVDIRILKAIDDLSLILFILQTISAIFFILRALGFDVKKFNFGKDLELDISRTESEEFEFDVSVDTNKAKRNIKRNIRNIKYVYKENRFFIRTGALIFIIVIGVSIYLYSNVINKVYKVGEVFNIGTLNIKVDDAFITNQKYDQNIITNNTLVVVRLEAISKYSNDSYLSQSKFQLLVNNIPFNHTEKYSNDLLDIGNIYKDQNIDMKHYSDYIMVFEIPNQYVDKEMVLIYNIGSNKKIKVDINPKKLNIQSVNKEVELNDKLVINNDIVNNATINISSVEINSKMPVYYDFKSLDGIMYESYEYLVPSYTDNYEKTIMKLVGNVVYDGDNKNPNLKNLYNFINYFVTIEYKINGETKIFNSTIRRVNPTKINYENEFYIEVNKEIEKADSITLNFNIRNDIYRYKVK